MIHFATSAMENHLRILFLLLLPQISFVLSVFYRLLATFGSGSISFQS